MNDIYISVVKCNEKYYIAMGRESGVVNAYLTQEDGLKSYEKTYNEWHNRSHEASMSACLNYMYFQPSVVFVSGIQEIMKIASPPAIYDLHHVSGHMVGLLIPDSKVGEEYWNRGKKPQLVKR